MPARGKLAKSTRSANPSRGHAGRPRSFDADVALDAAMRVFWSKSYEGATMADLTRAMRINRSSMYAAFGDKEALYRHVLERYRQGPMSYFGKAFALPTARAAIKSLVDSSVEFLSTPGNPPGCLSIQAGLACGTNNESAKRATIAWRKTGQAMIEKRLREAKQDGDLRASADPAELAGYVAMILAGLAVQAAGGATKAELRRLAAFALRSIGY